MDDLIGTGGTMVLAQGAGVDPAALWSIVADGGLVAFILLAVWMFKTEQIVSGTTFTRVVGERDAIITRVIGERNESHERERALHARIEQDVIPLVTEVSLIAQRLLDADRDPRT